MVWISQVMDGQPRFLKVRAPSLRFHLAAGWAQVAESEVPEEIRNPRRARLEERLAERSAPEPAPPPVAPAGESPASDEASNVAAPRRRRSPTPDVPAEEN